MQKELLNRFLKYVRIESQSKGGVATVPSTESQREFAKALQAELQSMGVSSKLNEHSILLAHLPSNLPQGFNTYSVGFVAHLDTVDMGLRPSVQPHVVANYQGGDILLNKEQGIWLKAPEYPEIEKYIGQNIVVTDGLSVLGADNKAAVSCLMTMAEQFTNENIPHGDIYLAFVPDEEVGLKGSKLLNKANFPVDFAYTIDSCEVGEVVYETFNAASFTIDIKGVTAHPMNAKGIMVNPILIANRIINALDPLQTPEHTEDTEGYFWVNGMNANKATAKLNISIRDHNKVRFAERKQLINELVAEMSAAYPKAQISCSCVDEYGNIADAVNEDNKFCIDYLLQAISNVGVQPKVTAMRGGTDGSAISQNGILTPNFFTGGHNFHSICEFLPMGSLELAYKTALEINKLVVAAKK